MDQVIPHSGLRPQQRNNWWLRLRSNPGAVLALGVICSLALMAFIGPRLLQSDAFAIEPAEQLQSPSLRHVFGTDSFGRDTFTRIVHGASLSMLVGLVPVAIAVALGVALGLPAGYYGGRVDFVIMRLVDVMLAFPSILLALAIVAVLGPSLSNVMLAVGLSGVPVNTRLVRATVLSARENLYVESARAVGCGGIRIMVHHLLPNVVAPLIVVGTLGVASAILAAAALSFLGMGAQPPTPEWGAMLSEGRDFLRVAWWLTTFPGLFVVITVLAVNMLGDGLRDALDPRLV